MCNPVKECQEIIAQGIKDLYYSIFWQWVAKTHRKGNGVRIRAMESCVLDPSAGNIRMRWAFVIATIGVQKERPMVTILHWV
jgi:hypothetical protein